MKQTDPAAFFVPPPLPVLGIVRPSLEILLAHLSTSITFSLGMGLLWLRIGWQTALAVRTRVVVGP
jgi:hypothetical protein